MNWRDASREAKALERRASRLEPEDDGLGIVGRYTLPGFFTDALGLQSATRRSTGDAYQLSVLRDLEEHDRVAVVSGHGVGKTTTLGAAATGFVLAQPYRKVVVVAPTFGRQVRAQLFSDIRRRVRQARVPLPVEVLSDRVLVRGYGEEWAIIGVPATEPDRIEGFHSEAGVLLVLDESKGIGQDVYDALQGALTGGGNNRLLIASTPGGPSGFLFDAVTKHRDLWRIHEIPSTDSSLVSPAWCEDRAREWGEGSPIYQARVLGKFPEEAEGTLYPLSLLEAAAEREIPRRTDGPEPVSLGVDPARFGPDRTAVAVWRGATLEAVETRQGLDTMETASWVASLILMRHAGSVRVDSIGIGSGVADRLRQLGHPAADVNVSERAARADLFFNRRSELAWRLREALEAGTVALPPDEALLAELSALKYRYDATGRIRLEEKSEAKKHLGRSPDRADACILGFAESVEEPLPAVDVTTLGDLSQVARSDYTGGTGADEGSWEPSVWGLQ